MEVIESQTSLSGVEKLGLEDLFSNPENYDLLINVANSLTKNMLEIESKNDALNAIFLHSTNAKLLLCKKMITKNILFKYLHNNSVPITTEKTKIALIEEISHYWQEKFQQTETDSQQKSFEMLGIKFSEWFFKNWNENNLKTDDFWPNTNLEFQIIENNDAVIEEYEATTSLAAMNVIIEIRRKYQFYLNANTTNQGTAQRIDCHGLVMILSCGTMHFSDLCTGVFESIFGLIKDPQVDNNWKIKTIKIIFKITEKRATLMLGNIT